jgi:alginate O-acetyltransferase complex protein AlgI
MVFSSLIFLYGFFSISLLAYWLCPNQKAKNVSLLVFSLMFYAWGEPKYLLLLMFMAFVSWLCALGVSASNRTTERKIWVAVAAVTDIALIGFFKYAGLVCSVFGPVPEFIRKIALPIGISFYTFQLLTYVIDVYRKEAAAQKSYWNVLLYASLFHQCIAGPIVRYQTVADELFGERKRKPQVALGTSRFCAGLAKKALLANPCGALADSLLLSDAILADAAKFSENLGSLSQQSVLGSWLGIIAYALHIYLDFSAYSDMAIGMGRMIGFHFKENFNYPYTADSVTDFWRRWHISLSSFFRDYVYIPLGGNRCSKWRHILNLLIVWALTGFWHGASWNFILWGLYFALFLVLEKYVFKWQKHGGKITVHFRRLYTLAVVWFGWFLFRFDNMTLMGQALKSLFGGANGWNGDNAHYTLRSYLFILIVAMIACTPIIPFLSKKLTAAAEGKGVVSGLARIMTNTVAVVAPVALLVLSALALVGDSYNPFLYFRF